jgi:sugar transferase (PEP-CTERM/EpsH1 system associated)
VKPVILSEAKNLYATQQYSSTVVEILRRLQLTRYEKIQAACLRMTFGKQTPKIKNLKFKMKFLFLTPQYPYPPHKGTTLRNFNIIANLAQRHQIDLLTFAEVQPPADSPLSKMCNRIALVPLHQRSIVRRAIDTILSPWPDMGLRLWSREYKQKLAEWLADSKYDVIQVEGIELARYALALPHPPGGFRTSGRIILFDDHNSEYMLQQRIAEAEIAAHGWNLGAIYSSIQTRKLRGFERAMCRRADRIAVVSDADAAAIQQLDPSLKVNVIPNGVDTELYRRDKVTPIVLPPHSLVFTGTMDFRPNVDAVLWFAQEVLPLVRQSIADAQFVIVGQRPHERLDVLRDETSITITGDVEDTRPYIVAASVYVIPLRMGSGTRLKVLEAFSLEAPIVSTTLGAEGFPIEHNRELLLADDPVSFARSIVELIADPARGQALGQAGRALAIDRYEWRKIVPKFEECLNTAA